MTINRRDNRHLRKRLTSNEIVDLKIDKHFMLYLNGCHPLFAFFCGKKPATSQPVLTQKF